jgi:mycothiol synthase
MEIWRVKALLRIRPFVKESDEEAYVRIFNAAFADYDDVRTMTLEEMRKTEESPSYSADGLFIAEWNGETAGMVDAYVDKLRKEEKGFIQSLGVLPQFRRKGIARKLVQKAVESLKTRGMKVADTWVQSDRTACVHLFESFGFKRIRFTSMMKRSLNEIPVGVGENREARIEELQPKKEDDVALLTKLDNEAFKEHFNYRPRTVEEMKYALLEMPWFQQERVFSAFLENQAVGYIITGIDEGLNREKAVKRGWILDIGVLKPFRRKEIGAMLMLHGMRILKTYGLEEALLYVDNMNPTGAIKLYEKLGFKVMHNSMIYQLRLA